MSQWFWVGAGDEKNGNTYYKSVRYVKNVVDKGANKEDNLERIYKVGDTVVIRNGIDRPQVAHLVELFQKGVAVQDDEIEFVTENTSGIQARMRCTLRWFIDHDEEDVQSAKPTHRDFPNLGEGDVVFSEQVHRDDLGIIVGRAYMCATQEEFEAMKNEERNDCGEEDVIRLVRCIYGFGHGHTGKLRELLTGELTKLLENPTTNDALYSSSLNALHGGRRMAPRKSARPRRGHQVPAIAGGIRKIDRS